MRIQSSAINMRCVTSSVKRASTPGFSNVFAGYLRPAPGTEDRQAPHRTRENTRLAMPVETAGRRAKISVVRLEGGKDADIGVNGLERGKMLMVQQVIERLTGKKVRFYAVKDMGSVPEPVKNSIESQNLAFTSDGVIRTADGRQINFTVQLNMSKKAAGENGITPGQTGRSTDPLVINFDAAAPELTQSKFAFDIDFDGNSEEIPFLTGGSGFLAVDLNSDGLINNGGELFGPRSGNGFLDLAAYDSDKNNWIDENDPIYNQLRIWTRDADGRDTLFALGVKGIGAVYLGNVMSDYSLDTPSGEAGADITQTGIFLREDGTAGTVQDMNFWV